MMIGIDFEYQSRVPAYKLICVCLTEESGAQHKFWLRTDTVYQNKVDEFVEYMKAHKSDTFIAHALDLAESPCLRQLGIEPCEYKFIDTFSLAKILDAKLTEKIKKKVRTVTTEDGEQFEKDEDKDKEKTCSLAACVRDRLFVDIDTVRKEEMRKLCIQLNTDGHEEEIMDYCLDDTKYLIPLANHMLSEYQSALDHSLPVGNCGDAVPSAIDVALDIGYVCNCCAKIAWRGIPVARNRVEYLIAHASELLKQSQDELNAKYPGVYVYEGPKCDPKRKFVFKKDVLLNQYMLPIAKKAGIAWPMTEKGSYALTDKFIKSIRGVDPVFEDYHQFYNAKKVFSNIAKPMGDTNWLKNFDEESSRVYYQSLRPYSSNTFRCQPATSRGFIPGWAKTLFCLLDPAPGRVLVEFDFKSEETAIQAALCNDDKYRDLYNSKDLYLWIAAAIGQIPKTDFDTMSKDDLKHKYPEIRDRAKRFFLGYSYGAGAATLSQQCNISERQAQQFIYKTDKTFSKAVSYKTRWIYKTQNPVPGITHWRLPDGTVVRVQRKRGEKVGKETVIKNWQFQAFGSVIIRKLIKWAYENRVPLFATVHDAVWAEFEDDGKKEIRINWIRNQMKRIADEVLGEDIMQVGSPDVVEHGKLWAPDQSNIDDWLRLTGGVT